LDLVIAGVGTGLALIVLSSAFLQRIPEAASGMLVMFIWVFAESAFLSTWGTTPGKWLFKITLRDPSGQKLSFSKALGRSFNVWATGMGIGFPLATLITLVLAYKRLSRDGVTAWDRDGRFRVTHERIGALRVILAILLFLGFVFLLTLGTFSDKLPNGALQATAKT